MLRTPFLVQNRMPPPPPPKPRFTWPPRRIAATSSFPATSPTPAPRPKPSSASSKRLSLWSAIEHTFLDLRAGPLPDRAAESDWSFDDPADYCPRCGRTAGSVGADHRGCEVCRDVRLAWSRIVRLGEFAGPLRTWIHEVKFTRWRRLGHDLGMWLGERLDEAYAAVDHAGFDAPPLIVPVPDSALRRLMRGIDHTMVIARGVQAATGWPIAQPLRRRFGPSQVSVAPSQRSANVARSFGLRSDIGRLPLTGRLIVLVDDVCTTGATLRACSKLIVSACRQRDKQQAITIWGAVLARTDSKSSV